MKLVEGQAYSTVSRSLGYQIWILEYERSIKMQTTHTYINKTSNIV